MDQFKVFTLGQNFPLSDMRELISDLHNNNQHYIVMVDPGTCFVYSLLSSN
jgi:alpha-glucosidase